MLEESVLDLAVTAIETAVLSTITWLRNLKNDPTMGGYNWADKKIRFDVTLLLVNEDYPGFWSIEDSRRMAWLKDLRKYIDPRVDLRKYLKQPIEKDAYTFDDFKNFLLGRENNFYSDMDILHLFGAVLSMSSEGRGWVARRVLHNGQLPYYSIEGVTARELVNRGIRPLNALIILDWLKTDPDTAKFGLMKFPTAVSSSESIKKLTESESFKELLEAEGITEDDEKIDTSIMLKENGEEPERQNG